MGDNWAYGRRAYCVIDRVQVFRIVREGRCEDLEELSQFWRLYISVTCLEAINTRQLCRAGKGAPEMAPNAAL